MSVIVDMWYGDRSETSDKIDIIFYPNEGKYRGNIYKQGKIIGDYTAKSSVDIEKFFSHLAFNWN